MASHLSSIPSHPYSNRVSAASPHVVEQNSDTATPILPQLPSQRPSYRAELAEDEKLWRDRYSFMLDRGLQLRVRYKPGWTPSWLGTNLNPATCEDSIEKRVNFLAPERVFR